MAVPAGTRPWALIPGPRGLLLLDSGARPHRRTAQRVCGRCPASGPRARSRWPANHSSVGFCAGCAPGVTDAVLNLHHLPHTLTAVVGDGSDLGIRVRYSWENPVLGSAGGPKRALDAARTGRGSSSSTATR